MDVRYIRTHWYDNSSLNGTDLTWKLTALLALTTASRACMIQHLNVEFMANDKDRHIFYFSKLSATKVGGKVRLLQVLTVQNHGWSPIMKINCF